jgi:hypothetical protein
MLVMNHREPLFIVGVWNLLKLSSIMKIEYDAKIIDRL